MNAPLIADRRDWYQEWPVATGAATAVLFLVSGSAWLEDLSNPAWLVLLLLSLFAVILLSVTAVVRHADCLAVRFGEPLGTLVLTLSVTTIEVMVISSVMFAGRGQPTLVRDSVLGIVMIGLNGVVGVALVLGGLRYREQEYNLQGANAFLAVLVPLVVLGLILPNYTVSGAGPTFSPLQATFHVVMSLALYSVFLAIQNLRHREYFQVPSAVEAADSGAAGSPHGRPAPYHALFLLGNLALIAYLSRQLAVPIDYAITVLKLPAALGGFVVSVLVMSAESIGAVRAALANQLQRSVNLVMGGVLASVSLTIPVVLIIGLVGRQTIVLGLEPVEMTLVLLTLAVSTLTFASTRTNVLLGAVHLVLFLAFLLLIFEN